MAGNSKNVLPPYKTFDAADMSAATLTSLVTNISNIDNVCIQLSWSGSPVGTFSFQGSLDYSPGGAGHPVATAGTWVEFTTADCTDGAVLLDANQLSFPWVRVVYTKSSGTGALTAYISGKAV